ncbi:hypothetical protein [Cohnella zeiphila]|uniref:Uncharacterized protein n=1 Tax=Cohnella zeiphila TaxID=2761120 RepID=A0A7X0SL48_9BACL|nr:hypothetical protein [Cohnella zeiphila]MBB6730725.1 hypothetical protein [Cohnella zeiphila]
MKWEERPDEPAKFKFFTKDGKPLRILSTSLGIALLANAALGSVSFAAEGDAGDPGGDQPKLVEWSTEAVKAYFDPAVDWGLPDLDEMQDGEGEGSAAVTTTTSGGTGSQSSTIVVNNGYSGFGWDDLLLYHLLFNRGSAYSSSSWTNSHTTYYGGTTRPYKEKSFTSDSFQNKPVAGSAVRPKTTSKTGSVTRRSSKSSTSNPGGIGGKSSTLSSSSSSRSSSSKSSVSHSSGGFGG